MPWKSGESGNPSGRPKGFGQIVRGQTHEGEDLVALALDLAKNAPPRVRMEAIEWLADRGFGKVPEQSDIQVGVHMSELKQWDLQELREARQAMLNSGDEVPTV